MKIRLYLTVNFVSILFCITAAASDVPSLIMNSSVSGRYIVLLNKQEGGYSIADLKKETVLKHLEREYYPLTWLSDTCLIYSKELESEVEIGMYNIRADLFKTIQKVDKEWYNLQIKRADFIILPNFVKNIETAFLLILNDNTLFKYSFVNNSINKIFNLADHNVFGEINNLAVDSNGEKLVFIAKNNKKGYLYEINLINKDKRILQISEELLNEGCYVSFTKGNDKFIFYKYRLLKNEHTVVSINLYNMRNNSTRQIALLENTFPLSIVDIPEKKLFYVNIMSAMPIEIPISKQILYDISRKLELSFEAKAIPYQLGFD